MVQYSMKRVNSFKEIPLRRKFVFVLSGILRNVLIAEKLHPLNKESKL